MTGNNNIVNWISDIDINNSNFVQYGKGYSFNIKFKNVWIDDSRFKGRVLKVPIFNGVSGDVKLSQLERKKVLNDNISILGSLTYLTKKGDLKKTILDCVEFYKDSLLRNINYLKPTTIGLEEGGIIIWYDFIYEGYPSSIMIGTARSRSCKKCVYRYINEIEVDEDYDGFDLKIMIGSHSPFYKDKVEIEKFWDEYYKQKKE
jgi:hypothetical protein